MRLSSSGSNHAALIALAIALGACVKSAPTPHGSMLPPIAVAIASTTPVSSASAPAPVEPGIVVDLLDDGTVTMDGARVEPALLRDAFAKKPPGDVAILRGGAGIPWKRAVHVLDQMRQAGNREFVLAIGNEGPRRTARIGFPTADKNLLPPAAPPPDGGPQVAELAMSRLVLVSIPASGNLRVDGSELFGPLQAHLHTVIARGAAGETIPRVVIQADAQAPYAKVVDATVAAQAEHALVAFAVSPEPTTSPQADGSRPRSKPHAFDGCPFPKASDKAAIDQATVIVRVKVDANGRATDVVVMSDPGHDFGAAAKKCAAKAGYDPATDPSGRAVAGEAVIKVRFTR